MATDLQKDLAEAIVFNRSLPRDKRKNRGELVKSVGYAPLSADKKSTAIIEAKGVKESLKEYGLTEGLITRALVNDIKKKPKNRLGEMRLGAEILSMTEGDNRKPPQVIIPITNVFIQDENKDL